MILISVLKTIYLLILLPVLIGAAVRRVQRVAADIFECYGVGMFVMMAAFWIASYIPLRRGITVSALSNYALIGAIVLGVISLVVGLIPVSGRKKDSEKNPDMAGLRKDKRVATATLIVSIVAIAMIIVSIVFVRSDAADRVPETVAMMLRTDGFYTHDPYSGAQYDAPMVTRFSAEAFYAVLASICGMGAFGFVHVVLNAALIMSAYSIYLSIARRMTGKAGVAVRVIIMATVLLLYTIELFHAGAIQFKFYQNIWYWDTLVTCVLLPEVFAEVLILIEIFASWRRKRSKERSKRRII